MPTTVYFSGSITGGRADVPLYREIIVALEAAGLTVLAGAVAAEHVGPAGEALSRREIFERDLSWLDASDLLVAEVSVPSHGVGYEIAYARHRRRIPVIALFRPAHTPRCSAMIAGDPEVELLEYEDLASLLPRLLESIQRAGRYPDRLP
ncbi:MAG TPA: nucleoside 2-deoxyribosyltransferase [Thermoanaerobaculia bacterium]|nr:nucleoside 2-deoxyribosyltransferase [Thermoanaerobaculia bacterium]